MHAARGDAIGAHVLQLLGLQDAGNGAPVASDGDGDAPELVVVHWTAPEWMRQRHSGAAAAAAAAAAVDDAAELRACSLALAEVDGVLRALRCGGGDGGGDGDGALGGDVYSDGSAAACAQCLVAVVGCTERAAGTAAPCSAPAQALDAPLPPAKRQKAGAQAASPAGIVVRQTCASLGGVPISLPYAGDSGGAGSGPALAIALYHHDGTVRRDAARRFSAEEYVLRNRAGLGTVLADRFMLELAFKLGRAPKYGA